MTGKYTRRVFRFWDGEESRELVVESLVAGPELTGFREAPMLQQAAELWPNCTYEGCQDFTRQVEIEIAPGE